MTSLAVAHSLHGQTGVFRLAALLAESLARNATVTLVYGAPCTSPGVKVILRKDCCNDVALLQAEGNFPSGSAVPGIVAPLAGRVLPLSPVGMVTELLGRLLLSRTFVAVHLEDANWDTWYAREHIDFCDQDRLCA